MTKSTITREQQRQILIDTAKHIISRDNTSPYSENLREIARIALSAMDSEPVAWSNGCNKSVPAALRYLAENPRPIGGESSFNTAHLYQMAREIELMAEAPLYRHAQPDASHLSRICAESYQIVGALAEALRIFNDVGVIKALDNLSAQELIHDDVLPFSVPEAAQPAPVVPDDVLDALQKVARIRLDMNDFDGDRRSIADCLCDAEEALIEVVNRRAVMLVAAPHDTPALNSLQSVVTVPGKWIPVSERMPESGIRVLLYFPYYAGHMEDGFIDDVGDGPCHYLFDGDSLSHEPTHWMPLPAAPQEVKGE